MVRFAGWVLVAVCVVGCGKSASEGMTPEEELAKRKFASLERLADALAKNAGVGETFAALDAFRNVDFDPKARPEDAQKIIEYYDKNVKGKYRGDAATELNNLIELMKKNMARP